MDPEQTDIPAGTYLGLIKDCDNLRDRRNGGRCVERYVPAVPREGIFRDAVPSRYVAIRQPSLKIRLDFMALGVAADGAGPRHAIDLPGS